MMTASCQTCGSREYVKTYPGVGHEDVLCFQCWLDRQNRWAERFRRRKRLRQERTQAVAKFLSHFLFYVLTFSIITAAVLRFGFGWP